MYHEREMAPSGAKDRSAWPVRAYRLGEEPPDDLSATTTPEELLAMMWPLALGAWELTGWAWPEYSRAETPVSRRSLRDRSPR